MKSIVVGSFKFLEAHSGFKMPLIVIYENPLGHDGWFVGRLFNLEEPTNYIVKAKTLEEIELKIPSRFIRFNRHISDDKHIVCTYL